MNGNKPLKKASPAWITLASGKMNQGITIGVGFGYMDGDGWLAIEMEGHLLGKGQHR